MPVFMCGSVGEVFRQREFYFSFIPYEYGLSFRHAQRYDTKTIAFSVLQELFNTYHRPISLPTAGQMPIPQDTRASDQRQP